MGARSGWSWALIHTVLQQRSVIRLMNGPSAIFCCVAASGRRGGVYVEGSVKWCVGNAQITRRKEQREGTVQSVVVNVATRCGGGAGSAYV